MGKRQREAVAAQSPEVQSADEKFFAPVRGSLAGTITLSVLGAASGVIPFIAIVELTRTLLPALSGDDIDATRVWVIVAVAVAALFVSFRAAFLSGLVSHFADAELQLSRRKRIVRHLQRLPLGWFDRRTSGTVRKLVENDVVALHQLVAHAIHDVVTRDRRAWPFLLAGFGMFTALGFIQVITGFIVQDRLGLDAETTGLLTGAALLAAGLGMILAQAVIVPRSGWAPATLLRVGGIIAFAGFALLIVDAGPAPLFAAILLIGLGLGIAMPGYTAGPTLLVSREEQGGLAGLIGATTGLTFVVAPTAGTALYGLWPPLPIIAGTAIMGIVAVFVLVHPRFRRLPAEPAGADPGADPGAGADAES